MSITKPGNLKPAHQGYIYQDLVTAYILAESLIHRFSSVTVDRKIVEDDRIDDLEVVYAGRRVRYQVKHSQDPAHKIERGDFIYKNSSLRIDRLIKNYIEAGENKADEYRLCATWQLPSDESFLDYLKPLNTKGTINGSSAYCFRLHSHKIWPLGGEPIWPYLKADSFKRKDFVEFCNHFVIELNLPQSSQTLFDPGPLEQALLIVMANKVGIGLYPNQKRDPKDVSGLLVSVANLARAHEATLTPEEVETLLSLRTDYGRIAQSFPISKDIFQNREILRPVMSKAAVRSKHQLLIGPPGSGKSWELTKLAEDLMESGAIVARHYCYLEPGDELVERRITVDVFFGNIMAELTDQEPSIRDASTRRYSAGPQELEALLIEAVKTERPIVLILDGIDHISRVLSEARSIRDDETDIVDQLCLLRIPPGVTFIVGSQPGEHLVPLLETYKEQITKYEVPQWSTLEITGLAKKLGIEKMIMDEGFESNNHIFDILSERSEGNPLYATYLTKELINRHELGKITSPEEWLQEAPVISGNIAKYYSHIYKHANDAAKAIADLLGVLDFGVSEDDLRAILPSILRGWIPQALKNLSPILISISSQGGVRIFHESFRRFMVDELKRSGRSIEDVLKPVIDWLTEQGFFQSSKAYRFLLQALLRANRIDDVFELVDSSFMSNSITHSHSKEAIERNLALAIDMAARSLRWEDLIRCVELSRSAHTCFEEKLYDPIPYWETYLDLFGPDAIVERLLFDGKITQEPGLGLILCSLVDDSGGTPPWREYMKEYKKSKNQESDEHEMVERISLAMVHGRIRIEGFAQVAESLMNFMVKNGEHASAPYLRAISSRIAKIEGCKTIEKMISQIENSKNKSGSHIPKIVVILRLVLAEFFRKKGDKLSASKAVQPIVENLNSPELSVECLWYWAQSNARDLHALTLSKLDLGFGKHIDDNISNEIYQWIASIRLVAVSKPEILSTEKNRLIGEGWYRCWLRFVIALAEVEAAKIKEEKKVPSIVDAFKLLLFDTRPFYGKPRACDLYPINGLILDSLKRGFSFIEYMEDWTQILKDLSMVIDRISTSLDNSPSGPIYIDRVLKALLPYANRSDLAPLICSFAETKIADKNATGTYFEYHAEQSMALARILKTAGDVSKSHYTWNQIGIYLTSYGFRKDTTIYEILDSIPALLKAGKEEAFKALVASQPLAEALLHHTDGRSTRGAPLTWFCNLLKCDVAKGFAVLAQPVSVRDVATGWPLEDALQEALEEILNSGDPTLIDALYSTFPFEVEYENESQELASNRLVVISRILKKDANQGIESFKRFTAQVSGDGKRYTEGAESELKIFAKQQNLPFQKFYKTLEQTNKSERMNPNSSMSKMSIADMILKKINFPHFPIKTSSLEIVKCIRRYCEAKSSGAKEQERFINAFGYRLVELSINDNEEEAVRLIHHFARLYLTFDDSLHPLNVIAQGLERHNRNHIAAIAYGLAYVKTRGGGGWLSLGDAQHETTLLRGIKLDRNKTLEVVANEISYSLRKISFNMGISRHLIERIAAWGEPIIAKNCWWSAYNVIAHRLPTNINSTGIFKSFNPVELPDWSMEEGMVAVLLGRLNHPILYRKVAALSGITQAVTKRPTIVHRPLRSFLIKNTATTSNLLVLDVLYKFEDSPYPITKEISEILVECASGELWGPRILARKLLERIELFPPACIRDTPTVQKDSISLEQIKMLFMCDAGKRFENLQKLWFELPKLVANRFNILKDTVIYKEYGSDRFEMAAGKNRNAYPPTPVLYWEQELLETALHEILNGIHVHLWKTGNWAKEIEQDILDLILPNTFAHLGIYASRIARPLYPPPESLNPGIGEVFILSQDDPFYPDWRRVGYVERQWLKKEESSFKPPEFVITVYSGIIAKSLGSHPMPNGFPFSDSNIMTWWTEDTSFYGFPALLKSGPLMHLTRLTDWLGDNFVIIPPIELLSYITLIPSKIGEPLIWRDSEGEPAIVFRNWRIRDEDQIWAEPLEYEGCDLLMRPDIFKRLEKICNSVIQNLSMVTKNRCKVFP